MSLLQRPPNILSFSCSFYLDIVPPSCWGLPMKKPQILKSIHSQKVLSRFRDTSFPTSDRRWTRGKNPCDCRHIRDFRPLVFRIILSSMYHDSRVLYLTCFQAIPAPPAQLALCLRLWWSHNRLRLLTSF